jgi:hypothetical protein
MGIGFTNQNSSFFNVDTVPPGETVKAFNDRIISFSLTEEMGTIFNGSIELYDPYYSAIDKVLRRGKTIKIEWGYKRPDTSLIALFSKKDNPDDIVGPFKRGGLKAFITNPTGGGSAKGEITYSCNFFGSTWNGTGKHTVYDSGQRKLMVQTVMERMGIKIMLINFSRGNENLSSDTAIFQSEADFSFLNRMALHHGTNFAIGHGDKGMVGLFADWHTQEMKNFSNSVCGSVGSSITLNYKEGSPNVENYSFQQQASDQMGDSAQIMMVGGQVTVKRFKAEEQSVTDYKLNMAKIQNDVKAKSAGGGLIPFVAGLMKEDSIEKLAEKGYFVATTTTTAPQGYGWQIKARVLGNPLITAPIRAYLGKGFPAEIQQSGLRNKTNFWVRSATHLIDRNGYHIDLDIVDALTLTGGSFVG